MRVGIIMAGGNIHGRFMVEAMKAAGIPPVLVINEIGSQRAERLSAWFADNPYDRPTPLAEQGVEVLEVDKFDGPQALSALKDAKLDFTVNGGAGIFKTPILSIAPMLNAHPGLLPLFRGLDPVLWSVWHRHPVGATVHFITEGIDEGDIVLARPLPWAGARTILQLRLQCMRWGGQLLAQFLTEPKKYPPQAQDAQQARYFSGFPESDYAACEAILSKYHRNDLGNKCVETSDLI